MLKSKKKNRWFEKKDCEINKKKHTNVMVPEQIMSIVTSDALKIEPHFKNDHFTTISSHFFADYMNIFHKN